MECVECVECLECVLAAQLRKRTIELNLGDSRHSQTSARCSIDSIKGLFGSFFRIFTLVLQGREIVKVSSMLN